MIFDLLSAIYADIGENKCGTAMGILLFLISLPPIVAKKKNSNESFATHMPEYVTHCNYKG
jgi:RNase H-fold protein (predicted Holliday junction resolvase)